MTARILIVDDEENQRRSLAIALRIAGFVSDEAAGGDDALAKLEKDSFDVVVVDLMMPGVNGLELARRMRFRFPSVKVLITSAYHLSHRQLERADVGAVGFVPKPYRVDELIAFLREKLPTWRGGNGGGSNGSETGGGAPAGGTA